jgi:hypothetical protein
MEFHGSGSRDPIRFESSLGSRSYSVALLALFRTVGDPISFFLVENCIHLAQQESTVDHALAQFMSGTEKTKDNLVQSDLHCNHS